MLRMLRYWPLAFLLAGAVSDIPAEGQITERVSESTAGVQPGETSGSPVLSPDGRYVAFTTDAALVASDTNGKADVYVRDLVANSTERLILSSNGAEPNGASIPVALSAGGRYLLFSSYASNLVPGDTNGEMDAFVRDRQLNTTARVGVDYQGAQIPLGSTPEAISLDGRFVTFHALGQVTPEDTNAHMDIFRRDMQTGAVILVSKSTAGSLGNDDSVNSAVSQDGRYVAFESRASNLTPNDTNGRNDVFLRDTRDNVTTRVSEHANGASLAGESALGGITGAGRHVAFATAAPGLVPGDTNGRYDVFVRDMQTGAIDRMSVNTAGEQGNGHSFAAGISADGRRVLISSSASNLAGNDNNSGSDLFVRDRATNTTRLVTTAMHGGAASNPTFGGSLSADGLSVAFASDSGDIVPGDTNGANDIFVRDMAANATHRATVGEFGRPGDGPSSTPAISMDGRLIVFASTARNFMPDDLSAASKIFLRDRVLKTTVRADVNAAGQAANNTSVEPAISADGQHIAFTSYAKNLVSGDTNDTWDIFVRNLATNTVARASVSSAGVEGNGQSNNAALSADGRYVVFSSIASNLVSNDTNAKRDIFLRDTVANTTVRVSVATDGTQADDHNYVPDISGDGNIVTWYSVATNLVPGDTNGSMDVFVRDMRTGVTRRASVNTAGEQALGDSATPRISRNGRYVAFYSNAANLVTDDTNRALDVFVRDLVDNKTHRVSLSTTGGDPMASSYYPSINADGSRVAFYSSAQNLVPGKTTLVSDAFVRDLPASATQRVSLSTAGAQGNGNSTLAAISGNGQYVAFESVASNLVPGDTTIKDIFVRGPLVSGTGGGPFTIADAANALRAAGGLTPSGGDTVRLNVEKAGSSADRVDAADAVRIARKAAGLEPNP